MPLFRARGLKPAATICLLISTLPLQSEEYLPTPAKAAHWAWKEPERSHSPLPKNKKWARNPIDLFILAKLEEAGFGPTKDASRVQLIRRVTFDLIGLPPTPGEIDSFLKDESAQAWEKVIDRLLTSPHYGERWGRHWLDLARFAESNGYEHDEIRPDAWRYRDYVIQAFNEDKPYDRFIREQIAGDELFPNEISARIATGFNLLGPDMTDTANPRQRRQNTLDDMTDTAGLVFLGLTLGCARCHDHKFEPIPQSDFYRMQAFFAPALFRSDIPVAPIEQLQKHAEADKAYEKEVGPIHEAIAKIENPYRLKLTEERIQKLAVSAQQAHRTASEKRTKEQTAIVEKTNRFLKISAKDLSAALGVADRAKIRELYEKLKAFAGKKPPPLPTALGLEHGIKQAKTRVLLRGELDHPGDEVEAGYPIILSPKFAAVPAVVTEVSPKSSGRRAALARWLSFKANPLTARVMVNRLWQHHFGRGIVATPSDFGIRGSRPSHPELLDWLADEFMAGGWSIKRMHKLMLMSASFQLSTQAPKEALAKDPENQLFGRMNRQRLEGEIVRDALLAVSGDLNAKMGGPSVLPPLPEGLTIREWKVSPDPAEHRRRSVYLYAKRNERFPFLEAFDLPDNNQSCPKRERSTTAPQALALLNDRDVAAASQGLAARLQKEAGSTDERIRLAFRLALGREPSSVEQDWARDFLKSSPLVEFCRTMFNINEFVYLD